MNLISLFLVFLISSIAFALTLEEERKYDELEGLAFIRALSADKKFAEVVKQFPNLQREKGDRRALHYYLADAYYNLKQYQKADEALENGEGTGATAEYYALWARTNSRLQNFTACRDHFRKIPLEEMVSTDWSTYSRCLLKAGEISEAVELALKELADPDHFIVSQRLLISHGLRTVAEGRRSDFLSTCRNVDFYLRLWSEVADVSVLETAHACHPKAVEVTFHLVKALFQEGKFHSVAWLFETMSLEVRTYLKHAAEFYKVAGRNIVADYFFFQGEEIDFLLSRSSHFLNRENYAALLAIPLAPAILEGQKDLSYALAYSHFKYLALDASLGILRGRKRASREQQLEGLIEQCRAMDWRCRP